MLSQITVSARLPARALGANVRNVRLFHSSFSASKTMTEKASEVAGKMNKKVGEALASTIETGEKATQATKEAIGSNAKAAKEQVDKAANVAGQKTNQAAAGAREAKKDFEKELPTLIRYSLWLSSIGVVLAAFVNTTIDDKYGDPDTGALVTYSPALSWNDGLTCTGCTARFDKSRAYMGTWHDGTFALTNATNPTPGAILTASVPFTGSAVYVYCILGHSFEAPNTNTDMTFLLDGQQVGTFKQKPNGNSTWDYDVPVYVNTSIPNGAHTLSIENGHAGEKSLVILDYVVYTHEAAPEKSSNKTAIIAGAAAAIAVAMLVFAAVYFTKRKMRGKHTRQLPVDLSEQFTASREDDPSWRPTPLDFTPQPSRHPSAQNLLMHSPSLEYGERENGSVSTWPRRPVSSSGSSMVPKLPAEGYLVEGAPNPPLSEKAQLAKLRLQNPSEDQEPPPPAYSPGPSDSYSAYGPR
ncbi:hypothetical protein EYR40_004364 [Pleurotus pulmonarius]|nr:hypothetical protein EYR40_004364 [Pleurotus pulmonarius]KAF4607068.1 hypothetical protein EYR38_001125 [Pleurotus pulmonarius]